MRLLNRRASGSEALILGAVGMHLFEAGVLLCSNTADWTYPFQAFDAAAFGWRPLGIAGLIIVGLAALAGLRWPGLPFPVRLALLLGQFAILCLTSIWVLVAAFHGINARGAHVATIGIIVNQFHRIGLPFFYAIAVRARLRIEP